MTTRAFSAHLGSACALALLLGVACRGGTGSTGATGSTSTPTATSTGSTATSGSGATSTGTGTGGITAAPRADVVSVAVTGSPGSYTFAVGIRSDETGCPQYADWWEVLTPSGEVIYRRILTHSHPTEQPFVRTGSPIDVQADDEVVVRAHLNTTGYTGDLMGGTAGGTFAEVTKPEGWAADVESDPPQPDSCLF